MSRAIASSPATVTRGRAAHSYDTCFDAKSMKDAAPQHVSMTAGNLSKGIRLREPICGHLGSGTRNLQPSESRPTVALRVPSGPLEERSGVARASCSPLAPIYWIVRPPGRHVNRQSSESANLESAHRNIRAGGRPAYPARCPHFRSLTRNNPSQSHSGHDDGALPLAVFPKVFLSWVPTPALCQPFAREGKLGTVSDIHSWPHRFCGMFVEVLFESRLHRARF
ncbi:hypothetical protein EI94DRAFT_1706656 [Lactarius quietus]|nr:hypothetical protein EI94DRAFT_1706656 [Lactarius quietus]